MIQLNNQKDFSHDLVGRSLSKIRVQTNDKQPKPIDPHEPLEKNDQKAVHNQNTLETSKNYDTTVTESKNIKEISSLSLPV